MQTIHNFNLELTRRAEKAIVIATVKRDRWLIIESLELRGRRVKKRRGLLLKKKMTK